MEELKALKQAQTPMLTVDQLAEQFPELTEFQLRKRLKLLVEARLIEERRDSRYNRLLYSPNATEFLRDLAELAAETGNLKKSVQMLVSKAKGQGMAYHLMTKEELIEIIQRQNREIEQLHAKLRRLRERFKPVERRGFWQWVRNLFRRRGPLSPEAEGGN